MAATGEAALAGAGRAAVSPLRKMADKAGQALRSNFRSGARSSFGAAPEGPAASTAAAPAESGAGPASSSSGPPSWAKAMKHRQAMTQGATMAAHTPKAGDSLGAGTGPDVPAKGGILERTPACFETHTTPHGKTVVHGKRTPELLE